MTNQPHTPTTEEVRCAYSVPWHEPENHSGTDAAKEFNRWHRAELAAAEQRGAEEGWDQCRDSIINAGRDHAEYSSNALDPGLTLPKFLDYTEKALANPYRADQMEGDDE